MANALDLNQVDFLFDDPSAPYPSTNDPSVGPDALLRRARTNMFVEICRRLSQSTGTPLSTNQAIAIAQAAMNQAGQADWCTAGPLTQFVAGQMNVVAPAAVQPPPRAVAFIDAMENTCLLFILLPSLEKAQTRLRPWLFKMGRRKLGRFHCLLGS